MLVSLLKSKLFKRIFISLIIIGILAAIYALCVDFYIRKSTANQIKTEFDTDYECIIVLGAGIRNNSPSPMLKDRLDYAIELYNKNVAPKIIMSGDHGQADYDEVNIMKNYAIEHGVPSEDIFMDHAGFSTYESIYRARDVFGVEKIVIVTQKYHLYRALYVANSLGLSADGYASNPREYAGQKIRDLREILARNKDFIYCIFKPLPTYLGPSISVNGSGDITND